MVIHLNNKTVCFRRVLLSIVFTIIAVIGFSLSPSDAKAAYENAPTIIDPYNGHDLGQRVTNSTIVSAKYEFIARFTKQTTVKPFGPVSAYKLNPSNNNPNSFNYTWTNPSSSLKGGFGVIYQNVGYHNGRQVDLKITVNDWDPFLIDKKSLIISYNASESIGHRSGGYMSVNQTWEYVYHDSGKLANITGSFYTFTDIDTYQSIRFNPKTTSRLASILVTPDTWIQYVQNAKGLSIGHYSMAESDTTDEYARATVLINGGSITFDWMRDYASAGFDVGLIPDITKYVNGTQFLGYVGTKPARTEMSTPDKAVSDKDEAMVFSNRIDTWDEPFTYTITHAVPEERSDYYYSSYEIRDDYNRVVRINKHAVKVYNNDNDDVTNYFTNNSTDSRLILTAKDSSLASSKFYGTSYRIVFDATIKPDINPQDMVDFGLIDEGGNIVISNTAFALVNGEQRNTNRVDTTVPPLIQTKAEKFNLTPNASRVRDIISVDVNKEHTYALDFTIGNRQALHKLVIGDDLENVLDLKDVRILQGAEDVTAAGSFSRDEDKESFTWTARNPSMFVGSKLTALVRTIFKDEQDLTPYIQMNSGVADIPNKGTLDLNGEVRQTNEVSITTPGTKNSVRKMHVLRDGTYSSALEKMQQGTSHTYQLSFTVTNTRKLTSLVLKDDLENVFDLTGVHVFYKGKDVTTEGKLTLDSDAESFEWKALNPMAYVGKTLDVRVDSQLKTKVDLSRYVTDKGKIVIPNFGLMELNDGVSQTSDVFPTNQVYVETPLISNQADKFNMTPSGRVHEMINVASQAIHAYQLGFTVTNAQRIEKLVLSDDLENVLDLLTVRVSHKGLDITNQGELVLNTDTEAFTWTAKDPSIYYGEQLQVDVTTRLKNHVDLASYVNQAGIVVIPNTGLMTLNDGKSPTELVHTPRVDITTPSAPSQAFKFNIDSKGLPTTQTLFVENDGKHAYVLDFTVINTKKLDKLVLRDAVEPAMTPKTASVFMYDKEVTREGKLHIDDSTGVVTWSANEPQRYSGQVLQMRIGVEMKHAADLSTYVVKDGSILIPNQGSLILNNGDKSDDTVLTPIVYIVTPGVDSEAVKFHIPSDAAKVRDNKEENKPFVLDEKSLISPRVDNHTASLVDVPNGGSHAYDLYFQVTNKEHINTFVIRDDLEDVLNLERVTVFKGNTDVTSKGKLLLDASGESFTWTPNVPHEFVGAALRVRVQVQLKDTASFAKYLIEDGSVRIPNIGSLEVNQRVFSTNQVDITTPLVQTTAEKLNVLPSSKGVTKDTMHVALGEKHYYTLAFQVTNKLALDKVVIRDNLVAALDLGSVHIEVKGKDVTSEGQLVRDEDEEVFTWTANRPSEFVGQVITVSVGTTLKPDADLRIYDERTIPNTAELVLNNEPTIYTNTVLITTDEVPPPAPSRPTLLNSLDNKLEDNPSVMPNPQQHPKQPSPHEPYTVSVPNDTRVTDPNSSNGVNLQSSHGFLPATGQSSIARLISSIVVGMVFLLTLAVATIFSIRRRHRHMS